jgi:hypothetical protein
MKDNTPFIYFNLFIKSSLSSLTQRTYVTPTTIDTIQYFLHTQEVNPTGCYTNSHDFREGKKKNQGQKHDFYPSCVPECIPHLPSASDR